MKLSFGPLSISFGRQQPMTGRRSYAAGAINRLTSDWSTTTTSANVEVKGDVLKVRARARELERDDPYTRSYLRLLTNNVLGWQGVRLQMKIKDPGGSFDAVANRLIEDGFAAWGKRANCTVTRSLSWADTCRLILTSAARDGGCLVRKIQGFGNPFGFALQVLEIDHLDTGYSTEASNGGNAVRMGVEVNQWGEPMAYHVLTKHPGDDCGMASKRVRLPASEIVHVYVPDRIGQAVGMSWFTSSMSALNMLGGYREAELTAARVGACKGGYITRTNPEGFQGDATDDAGNQIEEMEPGVVRDLAPGESFVPHDPTHPNTAFGTFSKDITRAASAGMGVSYNSLTGDLEGVNFSSIRAGLLEDREQYKTLQEWFIEAVCEPVFEAWLPMALLSGQVALPIAKLPKFNAATWQGRRWSWVDPQRDIAATVAAIDNRLQSRTSAAGEMGKDFEDLLSEIEAEEALAKERGVSLAKPNPNGEQAQPEEPEDTKEDDAEDAAELTPLQK